MAPLAREVVASCASVYLPGPDTEVNAITLGSGVRKLHGELKDLVPLFERHADSAWSTPQRGS
jgi:hypothetical protein